MKAFQEQGQHLEKSKNNNICTVLQELASISNSECAPFWALPVHNEAFKKVPFLIALFNI